MSETLNLSSVGPGFEDPVLDAQACFRKILDAMTRPGRMATLDVQSSPEPLNLSSAAIALCLMDFDTPVFLSPKLRTEAVTSWLRFHCSAPLTQTPQDASFAILEEGDDWPALDEFNRGDAKYPDTSASLVIQVSSLEAGDDVLLEGPGIQSTELIKPSTLPVSFWKERAINVADFQLGVDCYLTSGNKLVGLPRTTRTKAA